MLPRDPARGPGPQPSGAPAIAAWVAAGLGIPTAFVGGIGADVHGRLLRETLRAAGVFMDGLVVKPGLPTATAKVEYFADGSRAFEFAVAGSAATAVRPDDLATLPDRATWVHVSGSALLFGGTTADTVVSAVERGRAGGAVVSVDPNLRAELADAGALAAVRDLCRTADVLFPSEDELEQLDLDEDELVDRGVVVCRTMAAAGARLRASGIDVSVPAVAQASEVVDPDGAGDTFAGAAIAARMLGRDWSDALEAASRVVARAIAVEGPMSARLAPGDLI
ncbi:MAG TPA: PfkB family carbohydrate kinase [Jatrophihabitantaceae bacterium]|jgi:sugar/nucleoside kinase (ribokinase family)